MITCRGRKISKPHVQNSHLSEKVSDRWPFVVRTEKVRLFFIFRAYISGNDLIVYLRLYKLYSQEYGYAFPTINQLIVMTNLSRGTLNESLKTLESVGLI